VGDQDAAAVAGPAAPAGTSASATPPTTKAKSGMKPGRGWSLIGGLAALGVIIGLVMVVCTNNTRTGLDLLVFGLATVLAILLASIYAPRQKTTAATGTVLLLVMWVSLSAALAGLSGLSGLIVRLADPADYYTRYGTLATATMPELCRNTVTNMKASADYVCDGSTWPVGRITHTGTVVLGRDDLQQPNGAVAVPDTVQAPVIGDMGYSIKRAGTVDPVVVWGRAPTWYLLGFALVAELSLGHH
jgi:hypothetical protein